MGARSRESRKRQHITLKMLITGVLAILTAAGFTTVPASAATGFNQYGYNYSARIFNGTGSSWCLSAGASADCMGASSSDKLIMKWNAAWDTCNAGGACAGAWIDNEWNGMKGGDGSVWHYKIVWSPICSSGGTLTDGGYCVWNSYEVLMDQGTFDGAHTFFAKATPNGYGGKP